jgi:CO/xanthine dehydrogenase FAD-binding subunit
MLGAAAVLQDLVDSAVTPEVIKKAASLEAGANIRNAASVGGTLASGDGKSPLLTVLLAMDATLVFAPGNQEMSLGEWLPMRANRDMSQIIVQVIVSTQPEANYMQVGRTPKDIALISAAVAQWPSGRTRVAIGGHLETPIIAMDGPEIGGAVEAAQNAYSQHGGVWASQEYLVSTIATLVSRMTAPDGR